MLYEVITFIEYENGKKLPALRIGWTADTHTAGFGDIHDSIIFVRNGCGLIQTGGDPGLLPDTVIILPGGQWQQDQQGPYSYNFV